MLRSGRHSYHTKGTPHFLCLPVTHRAHKMRFHEEPSGVLIPRRQQSRRAMSTYDTRSAPSTLSALCPSSAYPQLRSDAGRSALTAQGETAPRVAVNWIGGIAAGQRIVWSALEETWFSWWISTRVIVGWAAAWPWPRRCRTPVTSRRSLPPGGLPPLAGSPQQALPDRQTPSTASSRPDRIAVTNSW